uniref:Protein kinase domain-containing protein n=1 Tax=Nothobranchius furzeri TaxID=105023 RepID=A0A8C6NUU2_NOTFU
MKSEDEMETPTLILEEGVQIIHQSDIYRIEEIVGHGCFGTVVKCSIKGTDKMVAVKIIRKEMHNAALEEIRVYSHLKSLGSNEHNIVKFIKSFVYMDCFCLVFELYHSTLSGEHLRWTKTTLTTTVK